MRTVKLKLCEMSKKESCYFVLDGLMPTKMAFVFSENRMTCWGKQNMLTSYISCNCLNG